MDEHFSKKIFLKKVIMLLFILTPLWSAFLFCLKDGRGISDIYIPLGGWSDEITYYKQIQGILSHGMPRGYFGYNQSRALYGSMGVWGLIPLIPYVIFGWVFGWDYSSPLYANIFFCVLALFALCKLLHLSEKAMGALSAFWVTNQFLNRYVLSGVVEASVIMQLTVIIACGEYLLSEKIREQRNRSFSPGKDCFAMVLCTAMTCMLSLARPYFAVFFLIPLWKSVLDRKKGWIAVLPILALSIMVLFFLNNYFFCSTYFTNIFSFEKLRTAGVAGFFMSIFNGIVEIARLIWYAVRYKGSGAGWYYLIWAIEIAVMVIACVCHLCRHKKQPRMFIVALIGNVLILLSIIELYDLVVGARHLLSLIVVNAVLLVGFHFSIGAVLALVCFFSLVQTQGAEGLPYKNDAYVEYMEALEEKFLEVVTITDEISYDNVVAMPTADTSVQNPGQGVCTYYGILFAMPSGVGISLDFQDFYNDPENIKAGYILVHPEGTIREILERVGMDCIFENDELALYARKKH